MKQLEELEQKILRIIQKNNELAKTVEEVSRENSILREEKMHLETSLLKETSSLQSLAKSLEDEKTAMKNSIRKLLTSIETLENAQ
ncbi:MAG: hypothetical protein ABH827_02275 [bacterium]